MKNSVEHCVSFDMSKPQKHISGSNVIIMWCACGCHAESLDLVACILLQPTLGCCGTWTPSSLVINVTLPNSSTIICGPNELHLQDHSLKIFVLLQVETGRDWS